MAKLNTRYSVAKNGNLYDTELKRFVSPDVLSETERKKYEKLKEAARAQPSLIPAERKPRASTVRKREVKEAAAAADKSVEVAKVAKTKAKKAEQAAETAAASSKKAATDARASTRAAEMAEKQAAASKRIFTDSQYLRLMLSR